MRHATSAEPSSWFIAATRAAKRDRPTVGLLIPPVFDAYLRIFHPAGRDVRGAPPESVRWRDIAAAHGRTLVEELSHLGRSMLPARVALDGEKLWDADPQLGNLPYEVAVHITPKLALHTTTPNECYFAVWTGFAAVDLSWRTAPTFSAPLRTYYLLQGDISDALVTFDFNERRYRSPSVWWPADHAWCVATEVDDRWTYVGGSARCIDALLADVELEAVSTRSDELLPFSTAPFAPILGRS